MTFVPALLVRMCVVCYSLLILNPSHAAILGKLRDKKSLKSYEKALAEYRKGNFVASEKWVLESLLQDSTRVESYLLLSDISFELKKNRQAISALNQVVSLNDKQYPLAYKLLADACFFLAQYDSSLTFYEKYRTFGIHSDTAYINRQIRSARFAIVAKANFRQVPITTMVKPINTKANEYWPSLMPDDSLLFFTRLMVNSSGAAYERIFSVSRTEQGWDNPQEIKISGGDWINEGALSFSSNGEMLFFTFCGRNDGYGSCDLYGSVLENGNWSQPVNLGMPLNSRTWDAQPSLAGDGRYLYFASRRDGGFGGMDIWRSKVQYQQNEIIFEEPQNLGARINTPYNDFSPFIHPDGFTLYFSSDGHSGFGGTDLFISRWDGKVWGIPENLGYPINSPSDDEGLVVLLSTALAIFSSDRPGSLSGSKDLYQVELPKELQPYKMSCLKGYVVDALSKKKLNATLLLSDAGSATQQAIVSDSVTGYCLALKTGNDYALNISEDGYLFFSDHICLEKPHSKDEAEVRDFGLQRVEVGKSVILSNLFFDFDSSDLKPESYAELDKVLTFLKENPSLKIEISGHTDNLGTRLYNMDLSERRAQSIVSYLLRSIPAWRLSSKGFGSDFPIAENDSEEGRAKNRRSEMKIIDK